MLNPVVKAETDFTWRLSSDAIITNLQESIKQQSDWNTSQRYLWKSIGPAQKSHISMQKTAKCPRLLCMLPFCPAANSSKTSGYFSPSMRMTHNYCSRSLIVAIINMQPSSFHNSNRPNGWIRSQFRLLLKRLQTVFQRKHTRSSFRANNQCVYRSTKQRGPSPRGDGSFPGRNWLRTAREWPS